MTLGSSPFDPRASIGRAAFVRRGWRHGHAWFLLCIGCAGSEADGTDTGVGQAAVCAD